MNESAMCREMKQVEDALRAAFDRDNGSQMDLDAVADILLALREECSAEDIISDHCLDEEDEV